MLLDVFESLVAAKPEDLERIVALCSPKYLPDGEAELDPTNLGVYVAGTCALAVQEKMRSQGAYTERFIELLDNAERAIFLFKSLGQEDSTANKITRLDQLMAFQGVIDIERFHLKALDGKYEEALLALHEGIGCMERSPHAWDDFEPLGKVDLQALQEAAACFEKLRAQPNVVKDWARIAKVCSKLAENWEYYTEGSPTVIEGNADVIDITGHGWTMVGYWIFAEGFAESRLSPDQWREYKETEERQHAETHMEKLFFQEFWKQLPELARDALVQADVVWWSRPASSKSGVVDNLWKAAVEITRVVLWQPFLEYLCSLSGNNPLTLKIRDLLAKPGWVAGVNDFTKLMWEHSAFPGFLCSLRLSQEQRKFVVRASKPLRKLNVLRNKSLHPREGKKLEPDEIRCAYNTFLGVGCEGILPRLARIGSGAQTASK